MALETATVISGLVATNPVGSTDKLSAVDDHVRLIKTCVIANAKCTLSEINIETGTTATAVVGKVSACTNVSAVTLTAPGSPSAGQRFGALFTNGLTTNSIARNSSNIGALAENCTVNTGALVVWEFEYIDSTRGWVLA